MFRGARSSIPQCRRFAKQAQKMFDDPRKHPTDIVPDGILTRTKCVVVLPALTKPGSGCTIPATVFQFNVYCRAGPCQLNSRANLATAWARARVTRAQGSAQGKSSTRTPHRG